MSEKKSSLTVSKLITYAFIIGLAFIGVAKELLYHIELIPSNAKIYVYPSRQMWSPNSKLMEKFPFELTNDAVHEYLECIKERVPATYKDVDKNGKFFGFRPLPPLGNDELNVRRGWNGSM